MSAPASQSSMLPPTLNLSCIREPRFGGLTVLKKPIRPSVESDCPDLLSLNLRLYSLIEQILYQLPISDDGTISNQKLINENQEFLMGRFLDNAIERLSTNKPGVIERATIARLLAGAAVWLNNACPTPQPSYAAGPSDLQRTDELTALVKKTANI